ncbi:MAG TPA: hypothetical protein VMF69_11640 [Gemmataceae bacterium]|nr:hypothetical protein [Gemmataceae bacterium]
MWLNTLYRRWFGRSRPLPSSLQRRRSARQRPSFRPRLEALEDRTLLSGNLPFANPSTTAQLAADITQADNHPGSYSIKLVNNTPYVLNNTTGALPASRPASR